MNARRFKKRPSSRISPENKARRIDYGIQHQDKTIRDFWQYIYFTDEVHFNAAELACKAEYELRQEGRNDPQPINEAPAPQVDLVVYLAAGISYNHKGPLIFYHDPPEIGSQQYGMRRPRRSSVQTLEEYKKVLEAWHTMIKLQGLIKPRGNSINMEEYADLILPYYIQHL